MTTKELLTECRFVLDNIENIVPDKRLTADLVAEIDRHLSEWKAGDKIRITNNVCWHGFDIGDEVVITYARKENNDYRCRLGELEFWIRKEEGEKI